MSDSSAKPPFQTLGVALKQMREQARQTLLEVAGAVEIDSKTLENIETGEERPSEDILNLLINYFDMDDQIANRLWNLAGYEADQEDRTDAASINKSLVMLFAQDPRTIYSDGLDITCNQSGVTLSFTQTTDKDSSLPVARIGMSYEQAERVMHALDHGLRHVHYLRQQRSLPPNKQADASDK
ncbi:MAG TPA: helix-turn-helix transcriptional regulator [Candidatus Saccharimonadales bacterium]|nr:helix-turn-helix transcriptional regulator [Candidatus Saccharimonadales bacterium]